MSFQEKELKVMEVLKILNLMKINKLNQIMIEIIIEEKNKINLRKVKNKKIYKNLKIIKMIQKVYFSWQIIILISNK